MMESSAPSTTTPQPRPRGEGTARSHTQQPPQSAPRVGSPRAGVRRSPRLAQEQSTPAPTAPSLSTRGAPGSVATSPSPGTATVSPSSSTPLPSTTQTTTQSVATATDSRRHQLVVRPIIKKTHAQQERSCEQLDDVVFNGATFGDIITKIWEHLSSRVKARAVKMDGVWTTQVPTKLQWPKMMQFKHNRHLVDSAKSEAAWDKWLQAMQGETVLLLVYVYGVAIGKGQDLKEFEKACIVPEETDRAGATAESGLHEVVEKLQSKWGQVFQANAVVWRMWANHVTRNLNRSTWDAAIAEPPPAQVACLLQAADSRVEEHVANVSRSASMALDCVNASIAGNKQLRKDWKAFGRRLDDQDTALVTHKSDIEAFINGVLPPRDVID
ncbi:hypothetical protein PF002_g13571 [Phytophthora fragariae]|uniref:Uncharacterized protein n=1 Tax=Phytophthora fragariae TaxID=53985 RepID=A0A6A3EX87_9STRA|nr:hypothetical protein PF009_g13083 [Phytophthora fragariae]KAE9111380.1 hypothetical protein PF007_g11500 [Phytophthora fragariae]KAE9228319.1 hypothetical protein PF002_g13571 [Phytophthora fragariae]KAE9308124.1 hypothetical protein PF001_g11305 [Phytophthora fragariae]